MTEQAAELPNANDEMKLPEELPVLPLRNTTVFPLGLAPIVAGQERSIQLIDDAMRGDRLVAFVTQKNDVAVAGPGDLYEVGTAGLIQQLFRAPDGNIRILTQGLGRIRIRRFTSTDPYLRAAIEPFPDEPASTAEVEGLRRALLDVLRELVPLMDGIPAESVAFVENVTEPRELITLVASTFPLPAAKRQEVLEAPGLEEQIRRLLDALQHELAVRQLGRKIASETEQRLTRAQREAILREQMRSIQQELGEEATGSDIDALRLKADEAGLPPDARKEVDRELGRLASTPAASPEHGIIENYLDWMLNLPWNKFSGAEIDVPHARKVLDEDHYDLDKVKDRILEHLAVQKLRAARASELDAGTGESHEPILCFVGPPGVGKTSLGRSIARALGREFVRIPLGGVRDEAEIRGHRRTYIGALPGRIIQALRRAESRDPVFMLDEIDKVGADWRGDPSAALLEVLDPAQNQSFNDHYLGVSFDLSRVFFITTANTLETIPGPLQDRMETIPIGGYTEDEKLHIALDHLIREQVSAHGLRASEVIVHDEAIRKVIREYTREAGVRNLNREIATLYRKAARAVAEGKETPITIGAGEVEQYLDRPRFSDETVERVTRPGVVTGLAWTPVGGDILFVEATMMPAAEEDLIITGQLGDVMRESARAALSVVRSDAARWGIDPATFEHKVIHLHVPAGAVPKDGPSAGIAMFTALASVASGRLVRNDVAMTGEITLRGKVLPIGGVKEKVLAAHRAGVKTIILPRRNLADLEDVPADLRKEIEVVPVDTADDVLAAALQP